MCAHTCLHMSPAQAAQAAGVSRWTIMRAIKAHELQAVRDNRNQWKIATEDLDRWRLHSVRTSESVHTLHTPAPTDSAVDLAVAKAQISQLQERLTAAEADRDRWQAMAEKLADRPGWWARLWG